MKKTLTTLMVIATFALLYTAGCGGGGSPTPSQPTNAILTLSTTGTLPANTLIGGVDITINLPAGAAIQASPGKATAGVVTYSGAVTVSGVAAGANAVALASSPTPEQVNVKVGNANGFGIGEFGTVTCDILAGTTVSAADFTEVSFSAVDLNGAPITGPGASLSVQIQ